EQEEEVLQEEVLDFAPAALDDSPPEVEDPLQEINLGTEEDPRPTFISTLLKEPLKSELMALLQEFRDCFARHYHEMPGLDRQLVEHKLPIKDGYLPVKQARRRMSMDTELKVKEEIERLLKAGFIRPAIYADWLANIVPVLKRKTGAVRICVDYRNLNEASPNDEYPMPMADMLVDGAAHNQMLSFMDGNAGYNQIMMAEQDIHKTAFMCPGHIGKIQPFSSLLRLKQEQTFKWEEQHQQAFQEIKHYLSNPPVLPPPKRGRPLKLYVSASEVSIGSL
ncbi:PREDICTED: LOW QUALITY PROTEIN, partial [Prunus dulcis]